MITSPQLEELLPALTKAQGEFTAIRKGARNNYIEYNYATLEDVLDAVRPALSKNDLAIVQSPGELTDSGKHIHLTTRLFHASGQWIQSIITVPVSEQKPLSPAQSLGVAITYGRRYALMALLGVAAEGDDTDAAITPLPEKGQPTGREQKQDDQTDKSAIAAALQGFSDNLLCTQTLDDVEACKAHLLGVLPGLDQSKVWPKVLQKAADRLAILANRPPPALSPKDDTPSGADREAVEGGSHPPAGGIAQSTTTATGGPPMPFEGLSGVGESSKPCPDQEQPKSSNVIPIKSDALPEEQPMSMEAASLMIDGFRDCIRLASSLTAVQAIARDSLTPFHEKHKDILDGELAERWGELREFYNARARILGAKKGKSNGG
jgi:hypothetical protein